MIGFDINTAKVDALKRGLDRTGEVSAQDLKSARVTFTSNPADLKLANFIIVAVPTPINEALQPDLTALRISSGMIGEHLSQGTIVVYESTVYPGETEEVCLLILENKSVMKANRDFHDRGRFVLRFKRVRLQTAGSMTRLLADPERLSKPGRIEDLRSLIRRFVRHILSDV